MAGGGDLSKLVVLVANEDHDEAVKKELRRSTGPLERSEWWILAVIVAPMTVFLGSMVWQLVM